MNREIVCKCTESPYLYKDDARTLLFKRINKEKDYEVRVYSPVISLYCNGEYFTRIENRDNICLEDSERSYVILVKCIARRSESEYAKYDIKILRCSDLSNTLYHKTIDMDVYTKYGYDGYIMSDIVYDSDINEINKIRKGLSDYIIGFVLSLLNSEYTAMERIRKG